MTVLTVERIRRPPSLVRRMYRDSGVVTRMWGGRRDIDARSLAGVSPVRTRTRTDGRNGSVAAISASGEERFFWMSFERAFRGET
jgi:hypothetical protein